MNPFEELEIDRDIWLYITIAIFGLYLKNDYKIEGIIISIAGLVGLLCTYFKNPDSSGKDIKIIKPRDWKN